ncbi:MAG: hypothetical protein EBY32_10460 [Proteobacteria bacterium]|nr:hypothetical protein [Pseudomonadota bacterium]
MPSIKSNSKKSSLNKKSKSVVRKKSKIKKLSLQAQVSNAQKSVDQANAAAAAAAAERNFYAGDNEYAVTQAEQTIPTKSGLEVAGNDLVRSSVSYSLAGAYAAGGNQIENLIFNGTSPSTLSGNLLANSIVGGANNDYISGGTAADTLVGGSGNDTLFGNGSSSLVGGSNDDTERQTKFVVR